MLTETTKCTLLNETTTQLSEQIEISSRHSA